MKIKGKIDDQKIFRYISLAVIIVAAAAIVYLYFYYRSQSEKVFSVTSDTAAAKNVPVQMEYTISKKWKETGDYTVGAEYDFDILDDAHIAVYDWYIVMDVEHAFMIDSCWNGSFKKKDMTLSVVPLQYNSEVHAGAKETFGCVLHTDGDAGITGYTLYYKEKRNLSDSPAFWALTGLMILVAVALVITEINNFRYNRLQKRQKENQEILDQSFRTFAKIIDAKDPYTKGHSSRVACYSKMLAQEIGLSEDDQRRIYYIGLLHDIGKISVTDNILNKPGKLTDFEREVIQTHVEVGGDILKDFTAIPEISDGARYHHERWDGKGYSAHLKAQEIPYFARIICVADSYDAMSSVRCYRTSLTAKQIESELKVCSGSQFDPDIVPYMLKLIDEGKVPIDI